MKGLRECRPALIQLFCAQWATSQTEDKDAVEQSFVALEAEIDSSLKATANILLRFLNASADVPDRPKGYLKQAIRSIGVKPRKLHEAPEQLAPEAVAKIADHYVGRSKKFARQWLEYELGRGRLDLDRVKRAAPKALMALQREPKHDKRGGPAFQELPRLLATALTRVLNHWGIGIGREVHESQLEEGNLKTLIAIIKPLVDAQYQMLTGHALSPDTMVRYAIARRKLCARPYRRGPECADDMSFVPVDTTFFAHRLPTDPQSKRRNKIIRGITERRKATEVK